MSGKCHTNNRLLYFSKNKNAFWSGTIHPLRISDASLLHDLSILEYTILWWGDDLTLLCIDSQSLFYILENTLVAYYYYWLWISCTETAKDY